MSDTTKRYNGWTNYETWRVNLEVFDGYDPEDVWQTAESVEELVGELVGMSGLEGLVRGWVDAFLDGVNWQEIADYINEDYEIPDPDTEEEEEAAS